MNDEFLSDEFFLKLIRLGVALPENRLEIRKILDTLHQKRQGDDRDPTDTDPIPLDERS